MQHDKRQPVVELLERRFLMSVTYNRAAAVAYATKYANEVVSDGYFWLSGPVDSLTYYGAGTPVPVNVSGEDGGIGDDCAHFVSSCIGSQSGVSSGGLSIASRVPPSYGEPAAANLDQLLITDGYAEQVTSVSQLQPGDVIGYDWDGGTKISGIDHTVIYMGNGMIDAHSASHSEMPYNSLGSGTIFYFHIETAVPTPTNSSPANNGILTLTSPKLTAGSFSESDATQAAAEWQIYNGSTLVYDSGTDTKDLTSLTVPTGKLAVGTTYTWKVRYEDNSDTWSSYSTATKFTVGGGPYVATNSSPANNATVFRLVTLSASAFSDSQTDATQAAAEWQIFSGTTLVYDSGIDTTDLTSFTVPASALAAGQTYTWQVRYEDNAGNFGGYSTPTSFTTVSGQTTLTLSGSNLYLSDSADGADLNIWNSTSDSGAPSQTVVLSQISSIIIDGASGGSNITIDFTNGSMSSRLSIFGTGSSANNVLSVIGSTGNDVVSYFDGQFVINQNLVAYSGEGTFSFAPGTGLDSLEVSGGTLNLGTSASGTLQLSSLSVASGATLDIGSEIVNLSYPAGIDPDSTIQSLVSSAFNNGLWNGVGITSSLAAANSQTSAVGYYDTGSEIIIRATWKGDANCDGIVNADDLSVMALGLAQGKTDWTAGNFNYDTQINADDWIIFNYAVAYSNGRKYTDVFAPGAALGSSAQMNQILGSGSV